MILLPLAAALTLAATAPTVTPARTAAAPAIDGRLDDPAWAAAPAFTAFVQKFPDAGQAPSEPTTLRVLYDDHALYVGIDCPQTRAPVVARLTRRDREVESDRVVVDLDTAMDRKSAYHFEVSAAGVLVDGLYYDDTELSTDWDESWDARVSRTTGGWSTEIVIPLRILRFPRKAETTWGFQARRFIAARQEIDELAFVPRDQGGEVSRFGQLGPFEHLERPLGLELRPFAAGGLAHRDAVPDTLERGFGADGRLGADGKWRLSPALTLDFTVNPDFGQVEADQVVLNLTTYETFFPEKRPFFNEGLDLYATPIDVLYTRRIGAVPDAPALAPGETLVAAPRPTRIGGATKLTGRVGERVSIAALAAFTDENTVTARASDGRERDVVAAPYTLYTATRVKVDASSHLAVGAIATGTFRLGAGRDTAIGGADLFWRSPGADWSLQAQALGSAVDGGAPVQLPDGTIIASGGTSGAGQLSLVKDGGRVTAELSCDATGRAFDPGDLGYIERQNVAHCFGALGWHDTRPGRVFVEQQHNLEVFYRENFAGQPLGSGYQLNTSGRLASGWRFFTELHVRPAYFDDRELGDGTALERAGLFGWEVHLRSDPRRAFSFELGTAARWLSDGFAFELDGSLTVRAGARLDLELVPTALWTDGEPRYVGDDATGADHLFARQRALALGGTLRATYTFTPRLTLQVYSQLFVDAVHYHDFSSAPASDREIRLAALVPAAAPAENPDEQDGALNASAVLRWEWRLGSTLFLVYTHAQAYAAPVISPMSDVELRLPAAATLRAPAADALLVKLSLTIGG